MKSKEQKRAKVEELVGGRKDRTPEQQIAVLDARLGKGQGAQKERARLAKVIAGRSKK